MKLNKWLFGAIGLALMASCSDKDLGVNPPDNGPEIVKGEEVNGYLSVEIKLPQEMNATRVENGENDNFDDGELEEYAVHNGMIILFRQTLDKVSNPSAKPEEQKAYFYRAQELTKPFFTNQPTNDQITSSYLATLPVTVNRAKEQHFWALVILNNDENSTKIYTKEIDDPDNPGEKKTVTCVKVADTELMADETQKLEAFLKQTTSNSFLGSGDTKKFFMTNAPLSTIAGGRSATGLESDNSHIQYLAYLGDSEKVYETPEKAKENVSACVYVERAVAKVTYKNGNTLVNKLADGAIKLEFYKEDGSKYESNEVIVSATVRYALNNTNNKSYVIRNVNFATGDDNTTTPTFNHFSWDLKAKATNGFTYSRMIGSEPMPLLGDPFHNEEKELYRTYWCKDPNYYGDMSTANKNRFYTAEGYIKIEKNGEAAVTGNPFVNLNQILYCKENTFTVQNMHYDNSTLAVFEVNYDIQFDTGLKDEETGEAIFSPADHLFVKNGDNKKVYLTKEAACNAEITRIINDTQLITYMKQVAKKDFSTDAKFSVRDHLYIELARLTDENGHKTQTLGITDIQLKVPEGGDDWFDTESEGKFRALIGDPTESTTNPTKWEKSYLYELLGKVNQLSEVVEYTNGISYYIVPIMHFGDWYTPWNVENWDREAGSDPIMGVTTEDVYNGGNAWPATTRDHADKYLGRYGMVRNNWYELDITSVMALGYADIPDNFVELSDDNNKKERYFAVEIHTLSWARRYQNIDFK